jgi:hypothetical protein
LRGKTGQHKAHMHTHNRACEQCCSTSVFSAQAAA